jgi:transposase-like protein
MPKLLIADGHLGIWAALAQVFPESAGQRCWNHRIVNVVDKVSKKERAQAKLLLRKIP